MLPKFGEFMRSTKNKCFGRFSVLRIGLKAWKDEDLNLTLELEVEKMNLEKLNKKQVKNWKRYEMRELVKEMGIKEIEFRKEGY